MELQWNYEETQTTGETTVKSVKHINDELRKVVTRIFENDNDYHDLDLVTKYQQIFEILSFIFEDYRKDFEKTITNRLGDNLTQEQLQVEAIVFCSWASIEVMTALSSHHVKT